MADKDPSTSDLVNVAGIDGGDPASAAATKSTTRQKRSAVSRLIIVNMLILLAVVMCVALWLFADSSKALDQYIDQVNKQFEDISNGRDVEQSVVSLRTVIWGDRLNSKYRQALRLDGDYQSLINGLRSYSGTVDIYNKTTKRFNQGINGDENLDSQALDLVTQLMATVQKNYPAKTDLIEQLQTLDEQVTASAKFNDIGSFSSVQTNMNKWLGEERSRIEQLRQSFQQSINAL